MGVLDITCSSVISTPHDEAELENYLTQKEAKYHKVFANRYDSRKLQCAIDNQESISEAGNSVELSPFLSRSFSKNESPVLFCAIINKEDLSDNLHAAGSYRAKRKVINVQHNKNFTEKWKEMALNSDSPSLLALISTGALAASGILYHSPCYKSMQYKSDKFKRDKSSTDWNAEWKKMEALDHVVSYIIEHDKCNPGSVYVVKNN